MPFENRADAGLRLAQRLRHLRVEDVVVLGLPRGGVPVAFEVAGVLDAALDVIIVRKLGVPFHPELGMGAIGEGGVRVVDDEVLWHTGVTLSELAEVERREQVELQRRIERYRGTRASADVSGRTAVVVDDGMATGSTALAACRVARAQGAARVVLAVPVAGRAALARLRPVVDELVCLQAPADLRAIGEWYVDFTQTADDEVVDLLTRAAGGDRVAKGGPDGPASATGTLLRDEEVVVAAGQVRLAGRLTVPARATGVVLFAHGSGSSRHSHRNRHVARGLNHAGLATLLFDLLVPAEELDRGNVFDIALLGSRLLAATRWLGDEPDAANLRVGYFGASTGAGAALWAAAEAPHLVSAVVSRGGRPDLAADRLGRVLAPTLLIVGSRDDVVLSLNRQAQAMIRTECRLAVVPGATHLFEEDGALDQVAELAKGWFTDHLVAVGRAMP